MSVFFKMCRIAFGLIFIVAGVPKIMFPEAFAANVANYQILPEMLVNPVALLLPWAELVCGVALVTNAFTRAAALAQNLMMGVFMAALWYNISRGLDVSCGCFTVAPEAGDSMREAFQRDIVILVLGLIVMVDAFLAERRRVASAKFWYEFNKPPVSEFGEPTVQNGVLIVGDDTSAAGETEAALEETPDVPETETWELEKNGEDEGASETEEESETDVQETDTETAEKKENKPE